MKKYKISIKFKTLPRFGKAGLDEQDTRDHLGADQFFSALSLAWIELYGLEDYKNSVLEPFKTALKYEDLPWLHSSFFPEDIQKKAYYLPAPLIKKQPPNRSKNVSKSTEGLNFAPEHDNSVNKKDREPWIKLEAVSKLGNGDDLVKSDYVAAIKEFNYQAVSLLDPSDPKPFITTTVGPSETDKNLSLYAFLDLYDEKLLGKLRAVCDFLKDEGIGANRSSGYGQISEINIEPISAESAQFSELVKMRERLNPAETSKSNRWITLSDYIPNNEELNKIKLSEKSAYKLISKSGWIYRSAGEASDKRKLKTYMMASGSSFDFKPMGSFINVGTEDDPSFRYALAYSLGFEIKEGL